jgi:hypothetical protein
MDEVAGMGVNGRTSEGSRAEPRCASATISLHFYCKHASNRTASFTLPHGTQGRIFGARKGLENDPGYRSSSDAKDGFEDGFEQ